MFHHVRDRCIAICLLTVLWLTFPLSATADQWRVLTDKRDVREVVLVDKMLWCATGGGLAGFDLESKSYRSFTTTDGLTGIGVNRLAPDGIRGLWLAFDNHSLQYFDFVEGVKYAVPALEMDEKITSLNDISIQESGVYVATNVGVARIVYLEDHDRWVWMERYNKLGSFSLEASVTSSVIKDDYLWAGTNEGIARGDLNTPLPLDWVNYNTFDGLPEDTVRDITLFEGQIVAATSGGIVAYNGSEWSVIGQISGVKRISVIGDSLRAIRRHNIYTWTGSGWYSTPSTSNWIATAAYVDNLLWAGLTRNSLSMGGLLKAPGIDEISYLPEGPITNSALGISFASNGDVLLVGGQAGGEFGLSIWNGVNWTIRAAPIQQERFFSHFSRAVVADLDGGVWVGSFGGGLARFTATGEIVFFDAQDSTGSRLAAFTSGTNYTITAGIELDEVGNLWVVNRSAHDGRILVCIPRDFIQNPDPTKEWHYFHRSWFRNYGDLEFIAIDGRGRKWLGTADPTPSVSAKGIYVFDDNGTLDDPDDDQSWGPITGLSLQEVNDITYDPAGYIWVGSLDGAYYINSETSDPSNQRFNQIYQLRQQAVNSITIDEAGNKWFATNDGIMIMAPDLFTVRRVISSDPPDLLPDSPVQTVAVNPTTGWAYMGTKIGTAVLQTPYKDFGEQILSVTVSDNPFYPDNPEMGRMYFSGTSLAGGASVRIFTPDGRIVRTLSHEEAALGWDGLDNNRKIVADGVYLILTHNVNGQSGQGKVAVIRR